MRSAKVCYGSSLVWFDIVVVTRPRGLGTAVDLLAWLANNGNISVFVYLLGDLAQS
jgi:hypothetical protein